MMSQLQKNGQRWSHGFALLSLLFIIHSPAIAQLQLDEPKLPPDFLIDRIEHVEKIVAQLQIQLTASPKPLPVLEAQLNLWKIAQTLLNTSTPKDDDQIDSNSTNNDPSVALLYGLKIAAHADQLQKALAPLEKTTNNAQPGDDLLAKNRIAKASESINSFNARCKQSINNLKSTEPDDVDRYLSYLMSPLATAMVYLNQPAPIDTWMTVTPKNQQVIDPASFEKLKQKITQSQLPKDTQQSMVQLVDMMHQGWSQKALRSRVVMFYHQVDNLFDNWQTLQSKAWLTPPTRKRLTEQVTEVVRNSSNPTKRKQSIASIDQLVTYAALAKQIETLNAKKTPADRIRKIPIDPVHQLFNFMYHLEVDSNQADQARQIMALLTAMTTASIEYRVIGRQILPLDIRRQFNAISRDYEKLEQQVFSSLIQIKENPSVVSTPQWTARLMQMNQMVRQLQLLNSIPNWATRISALNSGVRSGFYKQMRDIALDLAMPDRNAGATAALEQMELQLSLFEKIPYEQELDIAKSPIHVYLDNRGQTIKQQIIMRRSRWAATWSTGTDPTEAGESLLLLRRLLDRLHHAERFLNADQLAMRLNRWAPWQTDPAIFQSLKKWLPAQLKKAGVLASQGQWEPLKTLLDEIDKQLQAVQLMTLLSEGVGEGLSQAPDGLSGMIGQCVYSPPRSAFGAAHRNELARLSLFLQATAFIQQADRDLQTEKLMDYCAKLARELIEQW